MEGNVRQADAYDRDAQGASDEDVVVSFRERNSLGILQNQQPEATASALGRISDRQSDMSNVTREEIEAKLATAEARGETRLAELNGKLDRVLDAIASSKQNNGDLRQDVHLLKTAMDEVKKDNKNTRWTIAITVVASLLAALAALWTTQSNLLSAFQIRLSLASPINQPSPTK